MWMGGPWHTCLLVGGLIAILVLTCCCLFRLRARLLHGHWCPSREELLPSAEPHGRSRWWCWGGGVTVVLWWLLVWRCGSIWCGAEVVVGVVLRWLLVWC